MEKHQNAIIALTIAVAAALVLFPQQKTTAPMEAPKEIPASPEESKDEPNDESFGLIQNDKIRIQLPEDMSATLNHENGRRGSFISYDIIDEKEPPKLQEVQLFSEDSIRAFNEKCGTTNHPCFFGDYPTVETYEGLKTAYENISDWGVRHMVVLGDENYLVTDLPCEGDSCIIREYVRFFGDTMVAFWVMMADHTQQAEADEIIAKVQYL